MVSKESRISVQVAVITHRVMVVPFLELRNTERSGVDGNMDY